VELGTLTVQGVTCFSQQVTVDFAALGPGVIAFAGPNGTGKTTILECSAPGVLYQRLPSRKPSKLPAWVGPAGCTIALTFTHAGEQYEATVRVDKSGNQMANLVCEGNPLVTGKVTDYRLRTSTIFGTLDTFLSSVFASQGGAGRFESLEVADRKAVFRWYLGLDAFEQLHTKAKQRLDAIDTVALDELRDLRAEHSKRIGEHDDRIADLVQHVEAATKHRDSTARRLQRLQKYEVNVKISAAYDRATDHLFELEDQMEELLDNPPPKPGRLVTDDELNAAERELTALESQRDGRDLWKCDLQAARDRFVRAEQQEVGIKERMDKATEVPCKARGKFAACPLLLDAQEGEADLPVIATVADDAADAIQELEAQLKTAPRNLDDLVRGADDHLLQLTKQRDRCVLHDQELEGWKQEREDLEAAITKAKDEARRLYHDMPDDMPDDMPTADDLTKAERKASTAQDELDTFVRALSDEEAMRKHEVKELRKTKQKIREMDADAADVLPLQILTDALGPDGVQALEIAAAGPRVATLANDLLLACYGDRFQIEVQTLKKLKTRDGYAEDCQILVHDGKHGVVHDTIQGVSGGERVIVDEALRMALSLFATERQGNPIRSLWRDEQSGQLDTENTTRYIRMLHRARELGGFHQVLFVSHDQEVAAAADVVLVFTEDGHINVSRD